MARARTIKPGFFANDTLAEVAPLGRLLFAGLWTIADRAGRLEDRPRRIKAEILPYDECDADELLDCLAARGFVLRYEQEGTRYLQILKFEQHQNPHKNEGDSRIPAPEGFNATPAPEPDEDDTSMDDAREEHHTSTVQAPEQNSTNHADHRSLNTDHRSQTTPQREGRASDDAFDAFWSIYPRKEDKKGARSAWSRVRKSDHAAIMADIQGRLASGRWVKGSQYIPIPTTYLNRERWNDELSPPPIATAAPSKPDRKANPVAWAIAEKGRLEAGEWETAYERQLYTVPPTGADNLARELARLNGIITAGEVAA